MPYFRVTSPYLPFIAVLVPFFFFFFVQNSCALFEEGIYGTHKKPSKRYIHTCIYAKNLGDTSIREELEVGASLPWRVKLRGHHLLPPLSRIAFWQHAVLLALSFFLRTVWVTNFLLFVFFQPSGQIVTDLDHPVGGKFSLPAAYRLIFLFRSSHIYIYISWYRT